jgi:hypothetical protein
MRGDGAGWVRTEGKRRGLVKKLKESAETVRRLQFFFSQKIFYRFELDMWGH